MTILYWLFYDFKYETWPMRIAAILLGLYVLFLLSVAGIFVYWLLTLTPLL